MIRLLSDFGLQCIFVLLISYLSSCQCLEAEAIKRVLSHCTNNLTLCRFHITEARKHILDEVDAEELAVIRSLIQVLAPRMYTAQDHKIFQVSVELNN